MRQGGMKPKSHSSGTYWIRANARGGGSSSTVEKENSETGWSGILGGSSALIFFIYLLIIY